MNKKEQRDRIFSIFAKMNQYSGDPKKMIAILKEEQEKPENREIISPVLKASRRK